MKMIMLSKKGDFADFDDKLMDNFTTFYPGCSSK